MGASGSGGDGHRRHRGRRVASTTMRNINGVFLRALLMCVVLASPGWLEQRQQQTGEKMARTRTNGVFLFADAASKCVCRSQTCDWYNLEPANVNDGDTCDTEPVDGVITANISCEDSDTETSGTSPTTFTLSSKIFERFEGDITLQKCHSLTEFWMQSGGWDFKISGNILVSENNALTRFYFFDLIELVGSYDLNKNPMLEYMEARTLRTVSQFLKINDNGRGDGGNGRVRSLSLERLEQVGGNGPETFYFDVVSDKYVTSNDNAWSLANASFTYATDDPVALEISGNYFYDGWMSTYLNDLMNVRGDLRIQDNYNLARIDMNHLKAIWGKMLIQNNTRPGSIDDQAYLGSYCKYDDDALNDTQGVRSILIDAYNAGTPSYYFNGQGQETTIISNLNLIWAPINQVVEAFQNSSVVSATQDRWCYAHGIFDTPCTSHDVCGYSYAMEQETFCGSQGTWTYNYITGVSVPSYSYECEPCVECLRNQYQFSSQTFNVSNPGIEHYPIDGSCPGK